MKCDLPIELLNGYLDNELDDEQRARVETHLKACSACREELDVLQRIDRAVRDEVYEEPSSKFVFSLNRRVMEKVSIPRRRNLFRFAPVFVPVAAAFLILIVLINISPSRRLVHVNYRMFYKELAARQEVQVSIPEPKIAQAPISKKRVAQTDVDSEKAAPARLEETRIAVTAEKPDMPEAGIMAPAGEQVIRAIIDSTGIVIKVATGNTLVPEKDTMLENELSGQQLSPPTIAGRKKQIYVDFSTEE
jgi:anti-sigma factor RsiW